MEDAKFTYNMQLTDAEKEILEGKKGETLAKIMRTIVKYGDVFGATKLVDVTGSAHLVTSFGLGALKPVYRIADELIAAGLKVPGGFTADPRPIDFVNTPVDPLNRVVYKTVLFSKQKPYEEQLKKLGLISERDSFTCTCYLDEVGNIPKKGDYLSWAESSAVVYANSVLGARCNRNSGMIELFGAILGKVPYFGLLTDEGRKATWRIEVRTTKKPIAQILGSAIGIKVMEDIPYVVGLDKWIGTEVTPEVQGYLKDFGAATASNGAVGLYHIENLTPEAKELGETLLAENYRTYVIDDAELERIYNSYPVMWKDKDREPELCFVGCPHLTYTQLCEWTDDIERTLKESGKTKIALPTIFSASIGVQDRFRKDARFKKFEEIGCKLTYICPLMFMDNPLMASKRAATNSNKLRTYTKTRYYKDDKLLDIICGKGGAK